jgi:hypothetical protein
VRNEKAEERKTKKRGFFAQPEVEEITEKRQTVRMHIP